MDVRDYLAVHGHYDFLRSHEAVHEVEFRNVDLKSRQPLNLEYQERRISSFPMIITPAQRSLHHSRRSLLN